MHTSHLLIKRTLTTLAALLLVSIAPLSIAATTTADDCAPADNTPGVHRPTGSDASMFTYQCSGANAGKWASQYYVYDPTTGNRSALYDPSYSYDCTSGQWTMTSWTYSAAQNTYKQSRIAAPTAPNLATGCPVAASTDTSGAAGGSGGNQAVSNTGPGSNNSANSNTNLNSSTTNNNNLSVNNGLNSQAGSGNSLVSGNTTGGNASTGDALSQVNVANLLQSTSNVFGPDTATFTSNINGDVNGDFMFDPSAVLGDTGPDSNNSANNNLQVNTNDTNNTDAQINNNIDSTAKTGDAAVTGNTAGGDATTGNAKAVVNLMNLVNSTVAAKKSFVGTVNINGNLNGDILLPQNLLNQLLASTGPDSSNTANTNQTTNSTTTNNTTEGINNNVTSNARTGNADISHNTGAGSASTGSANSNVTFLNLTGSQVVGADDLLVFVNVLGHWVGVIMNAPSGSTAASLGGGITNSGPNSSNATNNTATQNSTTTNNANLGINNNVNVDAKSGNAAVTDNTAGGNARTGNADTAVNIANLSGSNLNLSNWFGILFINVFGNWNGSFGVNTSAGDPVASKNAATAGGNSGSGAAPAFQFAPRSTVAGASNRDYDVPVTVNTGASSSNGVVLAAQAVKATAKLPTAATLSPAEKTTNHLLLPALGVIAALAILFVGERQQRSSRRK